MPITRKQFELGIDDTVEAWMRMIHNLLSANRNNAFSARELREAFSTELAQLYNVPPEIAVEMTVPAKPFEYALQKLIELGAVRTRIVQGTTYYAYRADVAGSLAPLPS